MTFSGGGQLDVGLSSHSAVRLAAIPAAVGQSLKKIAHRLEDFGPQLLSMTERIFAE